MLCCHNFFKVEGNSQSCKQYMSDLNIKQALFQNTVIYLIDPLPHPLFFVNVNNVNISFWL